MTTRTYYQIEQLTYLYNWEPVHSSESETAEEAIASMQELASELG